MADIDAFTGETFVLISRGASNGRQASGACESFDTGPAQWPTDEALVTGRWAELVRCELELAGLEEAF